MALRDKVIRRASEVDVGQSERVTKGLGYHPINTEVKNSSTTRERGATQAVSA
jgi:hypothetical protein